MTFRPAFGIGEHIVVLPAGDGLRVRSKPTVETDSIKFEPLLRTGTAMAILEGPVSGSGLWWYRVRLADLRLEDGRTEGWVAAVAADGRPWIGAWESGDYGGVVTDTGWPTVGRGGLVMTGAILEDVDEAPGSVTVEVQVAGAILGSTVELVATGSYDIDWGCYGPDPSPSLEPEDGLDAGPWEDRGSTHGTATAEATGIRVDGRGVAVAILTLRPTLPTQPCPEGWVGPSTPDGAWNPIRIVDTTHGLTLLTEAVWDTAT